MAYCPVLIETAMTKDPKKPLSVTFFKRDTLQVARELLGHTLVIQHNSGDAPIICKIVETEAYTGDDPACHAFKGPKGRAATLFKTPGLAYVYFIYGMYHCLNVVTEPEGTAGAVLFRALEPVVYPDDDPPRTHGPGRLCKALNITKQAHNEIDLTDASSPLYLAEDQGVNKKQVITTTRIGISQAQDYPWRFLIKDNPWVSVKPKN